MLQILKTLVLPLSVWMGTILRALRSTLLHTGANVIKLPVYHGALGEQMILGSPTPLAVALLSEYQSPFLSPVRPGPSGSARVRPSPRPSLLSLLRSRERTNTMAAAAAHRA